MKQGLKPHLHPLAIMEVVLNLEGVLLAASIPTADDLQKKLQQNDMPGCPVLQDEQHVPSVSEAQPHQEIALPKDY